ncbi:uncharacterized protein WM277_000835 isoform 3-T5 [Molossus nigricans]
MGRHSTTEPHQKAKKKNKNKKTHLYLQYQVIPSSLVALVTIYTWIMPKSRSRPEYPTAHVDNSTGLICRLGKMQPPALPRLLLILCPVTWCETWSCHCNIVVENGTLEPACQGLNSDLATYCVTLGWTSESLCQDLLPWTAQWELETGCHSERQRRRKELRWVRGRDRPLRTRLTQKDRKPTTAS